MSGTSGTGTHPYRWLLAALALGYFIGMASHPAWMFAVGVTHFGVWFLDLYAVLAANDALAQGLNVYAPNPLDLLHRPHVYSHWWLGLGRLGLGRADNLWLGLVLVTAFLVVALGQLRPRRLGEVFWLAAILCSSPVLLALERCNNDLVIFLLLVPLVPCLQGGRWARELAVPALIAVAAGLKYYPAVAVLILLVDGWRRATVRPLVLTVILLGLVGWSVAPDLARMNDITLRADGLLTFGALNLFTTMGPVGDRAAEAMALAGGGLIFLLMMRWNPLRDWKPDPGQRTAVLQFTLGALLLAGCFWAGPNFAYRWVFALWLAPLLWELWHDPGVPRGARTWAGVTAGLLLASLWIDPLTSLTLILSRAHLTPEGVDWWADWVFRWEQPVIWAFFCCLLMFLVRVLLPASSNRRPSVK